jgi:hypothetical protein
MISISRSVSHISRNLVMIVAIVTIAFSCTKSKNNTPGNNTIKYCGTISWSNTDGQSGEFTGTDLNGTYALLYAKYTDNGDVSEFPLHYDANDHLISDQPGITYIYTQNYLSQIKIDQGSTSGNGSYNFDSNGHLTNCIVNFTSPDFEGTLTANYTYDSNDDPVNFIATGTMSTPEGPLTLTIQATGDFLLDKSSLLPFIPVFAPATSYFSFIPFLSKHLLNKWVITISETGMTIPSTTAQYTYTYDANGNVSTMKRSENNILGSTNDTYTFTYSHCN